MTRAACSIIARMSPAMSFGRRSAIQTSRLPPLPSAKTCTDALWCVNRPPTTDQTSRRPSSSTSTIRSRATTPLPKVTILASSSSRVSTTKPGTRRVCRAPTSRTTSQTFSGRASTRISLRMDAIAIPPLGRASTAPAEATLGENCGGVACAERVLREQADLAYEASPEMSRQRQTELAGVRGRLVLHEWPGERPRYTALIAHGYGEHAGRYAHVAEHLVRHGASVYAPDHLGHGRSEGERVLVDRL